MKKLSVFSIIFAVIPSIILVPLVPFTFILIYNEGLIPGYFHENLLKTLMIAYPFILVFALFYAIKQYRRQQYSQALTASLIPTLATVAIVCVYIWGGIQLR